MAVTVSSNNPVSNPSQVIDRNPTPGQKWFLLGDNVLDGSFHPVDSSGSSEVGWIGAVASDSSGNFTTAETLDIVFDDGVHSISTLQLVGDADLNEYPVNFNVTLFNGTTTLYAVNVTNNKQVTWKQYLPSNYQVTEIKITINSWSKPGQVAKILEASELWEVHRSDTITVKGADSHQVVGISITTSDTLTITQAETKSLTVKTNRSDTLVVKGTGGDSSFFKQYAINRADTLTLTQAEQHKALTAKLSRVDAATVTQSETKAITNSFTRTDAGKLILSEVDNITAQLNRVDSSIVTVDVQYKGLTNKLLRPDALTITQAEPKSITNSFATSDTATITGTDDSNMTAMLNRSDSGKIIAAGDKKSTLTAQLVRAETLTIAPIDQHMSLTNKLSRVEPLVIAPVDAKKSLTNRFYTQDALKVTQAETKAITVKLLRLENGVLAGITENNASTVHLNVGDQVIIVGEEQSFITNIHTVMDADVRQVHGKVVITYTDPFIDGTVTITASGSNRATDPSEAADGFSGGSHKMFLLSKATLDGSYHPFPAAETGAADSPGWYSDAWSDATGVFTTPPELTVTFGERTISHLNVVGDNIIGNYPVNFEVNLYTTTGTLLHTESVTGNTAVNWSLDITPVDLVAQMVLTINKISLPNYPVIITEFFTSIQETYEDDDIEYMSLLEEQVFDVLSLPIGNVSANEITVRLKNLNNKFDPDNAESSVYGLLRKNRRIEPYLGAEIIPGQIEWYQLGVFWSQDWDAPKGALNVETTGLDNIDRLTRTTFETSQVYQNITLYDLATTVLQDSSLQPNEYIVDASLKNITLPYAWFDRVSHRDALVQIAVAALGRLYCNRQGQVYITVFQPEPLVMYAFDEDKSLMDVSRPLAWTQIVNQVEVTSTPLKPDIQQSIFSSTETLAVPANSSITETYTFSSIPSINVQAPTITADNVSITISSYTIYAWGMDITFTNSDTVAHNITQLDVQGQPLIATGSRVMVTKDQTSINDNGLMKQQIADAFIQSSVQAQQIASTVLSTYKDPRHDADLTTRGNIALQLGDHVTVPNVGGAGDFFVIRQEFDYDGTLSATVTAQKIGG